MWEKYLTPAVIGAVGALVIQLGGLLISRRKLVVDDNASLRAALMAERKQLVDEIQHLSQRCDELEKQRGENQQLINEQSMRINALMQEVTDLKRRYGITPDS